MRIVRCWPTLAILVGVVSAPCPAQSGVTNAPAPLAPQQTLNFDLAPIGLNIGFATRRSDRTSAGFSVGLGGNWVNYMALAGRNFSQLEGLSYEARNGLNGSALIELLRASVFVREYFDHGRDVELGLKASGFLHANSADDPEAGVFLGPTATVMWYRFHKLQLGSEVDAGFYAEGTPEFGINVAPVILRFSFP